MTTVATIADPQHNLSSGGRLVTADGRTLPLRGVSLVADASAGIARVTLEQRFENPYDEPLAVTYSLPLPLEGAVSGFTFRIGNKRIVGEIDKRAAARERFEEAISQGRTAALLEQDRSTLFTQEIGNVPPHTIIIAEILIDQKLRWLGGGVAPLNDGAWEWRFPTVVAPRYLGAPGRTPDAARVTQDVADGPLAVRIALGLAIRDRMPLGARAESPSHAIHGAAMPGRLEVSLSDDQGARLDRDVVVRWAVAAPEVGLSMDVARKPGADAAYGLLTVVPPRADSRPRAVARDLIVLLDTSGSMGGEPLDQARRIVSALIGSLREVDQLELIEFSNAARRWRSGPVPATEKMRKDALHWLGKLQASGSTEMRTGISEALRPLRAESQRQIVLVSDGLIGFESEVVAEICEHLPAGSRLHTVGVGSGVNRSLTGPAARAGRGVEVVVGIGEDPERATERLMARTNAPLVVDLELTGEAVFECASRKLPDLFAGAPALLPVRLRPEGGQLIARGRTASGEWLQRLTVPAIEGGVGSRAVITLYGREAVEDAEMRLAGGAAAGTIDRQVEALGLEFQIATRMTSWIAATEEVTVDPGEPTRKQRMPHELPHGMSIEGLGLRPVAAPMNLVAAQGHMVTRAGVVHGSFDALKTMMGGMGAGSGAAAGAPGAPMGRPPAPPPAQSPSLAKPSPMQPAKKEAEKSKSLGQRLFGAIFDKRDAGPAEDEAAEAQAPVREHSVNRPEGGPAKQPAKDAGEHSDVKRPRTPSPQDPEKTKAPEAKVASEVAPAPRRVLRGRITVSKELGLVIEVTVDGDLDWSPGTEVKVALADGREVSAKVAAGSTRAGQYGSGQTLRLVLELPGPLASQPGFILIDGGPVIQL